MLRILHTADWHLGHGFRQFDPEDGRKLARARLSVIDRILGLAEQHDVHAVLCAGDLFDTPNPEDAWWKGLAESFKKRIAWNRPVFLLPGNHDPLTRDSVYHESHGFRKALPSWVEVVDRDRYSFDLSPHAVVLAAPCRSTAGDNDLALALPAREGGDTRIRIGLVHGSTFDIEGFQTNFPIAHDAAERRGLDYLAIGDTHAFRQIPQSRVPTVYPSAPEPTSFKERDAGYVAIVSFSQHGRPPRIRRERVARWCWREEVIDSLTALRALAAEDLASTVLRLRLQFVVSLAEFEEVEAILTGLKGSAAVHGKAGVLSVDRAGLVLDVGNLSLPDDVPEVIRLAANHLKVDADPRARRALLILHRLLAEKS